MKIEFHGAGKMVTGSCHLIECNGVKILIDCGMFQGGRDLDEENRNDFGFDPRSIDFLLLTHAHLDHCGRIPLLVKRGFSGKIITTSATRELARLIVLDSAHIQEEEAKYKKKRALRKGKKESSYEPLYNTVDALNSLDFFVNLSMFQKGYELAPGVQVTFFDAGHILGSTCILLEVREKGVKKRVLFSGDLGCSGRAIIRDPAPAPDSDIVIMETTYGNRLHKQLEPSIDELFEAINTTTNRGGNVIIPSFALERSQELLYYIREGIEEKRLKKNLQVFLDSPMAISATQIFQRHPECYDQEASQIFKSGRDPFDFPGLHFTRETAESMALNKVHGAVIIAGSGMCTGGRVRHHLKHNIWREETGIVFVGYAANGTLARRIINGEEKVRIFGEQYSVRADVHTIGGFSAHGDQQDLLNWHEQTNSPDTTFLVHGEESSMEVFSKLLSKTKVEMPELHQSYEI